jgi:serine/threonine protein kinase
MNRCPSCFNPSENGATCERCSSRAQDASALPIGSALLQGRYLVGRTLGQPGGFGITYLGWDQSLERRVAIKEFYPRQGTNRRSNGLEAYAQSSFADLEFRAGLQEFLKEAQRLAKLDHQNIVKVHDYCEANATGYLVMSYYEGRDLAEHTAALGGSIGWEDVLELVTPILDGLSEVHSAGMIHRDVKPANIYLANVASGKTRSILIDFGAARWASTTHEITSILTEGFAPIEQYPGCGPQGPWTDIYAVAATMYALIAGQVPASAPSRMAGNYVPNLSEVGKGVPRRVADAIEDGLSVLVDTRPQSAAEFARVLRNARPTPLPSSGPGFGYTTQPMPLSSGAAQPVRIEEPKPTRQIVTPPVKPASRGWRSVFVLSLVCVALLAGIGGMLKLVLGDKTVAVPDSPAASNGPEVVDLSARVRPTLESNDRAIKALIDSAFASYSTVHYNASMSLLAKAHELTKRDGLSGASRASLTARIDSLAGIVVGACRADREILVRRGEAAPTCKERAW